MSFKFTVIKKNQILASAITMMLITAGYLNYKYDPNKVYDVEVTSIIEENLGDAVLVDANGNKKDIDMATNYIITNDGTTPVFNNNTELSNDKSNASTDSSEYNEIIEKKEEIETENVISKEKKFDEIEDYFISTRIDRTNNYAGLVESYENILEGNNTTEQHKNRALDEISKINKTRNSIMIAENLIKLKGFEESVVLVNENSINVIVAAESLTSAEIAQIQSIIVNEFVIDLENVHIINYE